MNNAAIRTYLHYKTQYKYKRTSVHNVIDIIGKHVKYRLHSVISSLFSLGISMQMQQIYFLIAQFGVIRYTLQNSRC